MSQADYARHRGVTKPAVSNWKKRGLVVFAEDPASGRTMVDVARTDAKLNGNIDPMRGRPAGGIQAVAEPLPFPTAPRPGGDISSERLEYLREQRVGQALKNADSARELVPLAEAEKRMIELGRSVRERVHATYRGLAERLAAERDVRVIMSLGEEAFDRVFEELADDAQKGAFAGEAEDPEEAELDAELQQAAAAEDAEA